MAPYWSCHACTYSHEDTASESYLACEVCGTARRGEEEADVPTPPRAASTVLSPEAAEGVAAVVAAAPASTSGSDLASTGRGGVVAIDLTGDTDDENGGGGGGDGSDSARGRWRGAAHADGSAETNDGSASPPPRQHELWPVPPRESTPTTPGLLSTYLYNRPATAAAGRDVRTASPPESYLAHRQTDRWSCGYRNLQNLIAFLCRLPPSSSTSSSSMVDFRRALVRGGLAALDGGGTSGRRDEGEVCPASILGIQRAIQRAWDAGYDPDGAADSNLRGRLVRSRHWIGTPEVAAVLRFVGVPFDIRAWSDDRTEDDRTGWPQGARTATECMLRFAEEYFVRRLGGAWTDGGALPPLYLQRRGHSVTCVGVCFDNPRPQWERGGETRGSPPLPVLLVSDTAKGGRIEERTANQLGRTTAWEVGFVSMPRVIGPGEWKRIDDDAVASIT